MYHHTLDPFPKPKDESHLYVNEPWLIDGSWIGSKDCLKFDRDRDNVRIYVPLDLSSDLILRRLEHVILRYGEANEENESNFSADVDAIISQIEIYDQVWYVRHMPENGRHSAEAIELVREFVSRLEEIPDGCAECFPFETIEELKMEYLES